MKAQLKKDAMRFYAMHLFIAGNSSAHSLFQAQPRAVKALGRLHSSCPAHKLVIY